MPAHRYMEENGLAAMLVTKMSAGVPPEVNLWEHITCMSIPRVNKAANSGFETQRRCQQKSKTGVSVAPQKWLLPSKFSKKKFFRFIMMGVSKNVRHSLSSIIYAYFRYLLKCYEQAASGKKVPNSMSYLSVYPGQCTFRTAEDCGDLGQLVLIFRHMAYK